MQPKGITGRWFRAFLSNLNIDNQSFIVSQVKEITKTNQNIEN